ncbi:MAG: hypothetical protein AAF823_09045 [Planctomycetota bacterium]
MRLTTTSRLLLSTLAICGTLALTGCATDVNRDRVTLNELLSNPTPELGTLGNSNQQNRFRETINRDQNLRALRDDVSRFMFFKDASRLTPYAIP